MMKEKIRRLHEQDFFHSLDFASVSQAWIFVQNNILLHILTDDDDDDDLLLTRN